MPDIEVKSKANDLLACYISLGSQDHVRWVTKIFFLFHRLRGLMLAVTSVVTAVLGFMGQMPFPLALTLPSSLFFRLLVPG